MIAKYDALLGKLREQDSDVSSDTTPALGGTLDCQENDIDNVGNIIHDKTTASDFTIQNVDQDKDIIFSGNDGGVQKDVMKLDVSEGALTGIIKASTGTLGTATAGTDYLAPIKKNYTAYISQTGTDAPTEDVVLTDDFAVPIWSYSAVGTYLLTKANAFATANKCVPNAVTVYYDNAGNKLTLERTSANVMTLKTYAAVDTEVLANGVITGQFINIEVYN